MDSLERLRRRFRKAASEILGVDYAARLRPRDPRGMAAFVAELATESRREELDAADRVAEACLEQARSGAVGGSTRLEDCRFLHLLARRFRPAFLLDVGTYVGTSASVLAAAVRDRSDAIVHTVDAGDHGYRPAPGHRVVAHHRSTSTEALARLADEGVRVDFVFADATLADEDGRRLARLAAPNLVVAVHDFKPPWDKGVENALMLEAALAEVVPGHWLIPERQGIGYDTPMGLAVNSSTAVRIPVPAGRQQQESGPQQGSSALVVSL